MSYKLEDCSAYRHKTIVEKDIFIFDSHTDTHSPFSAEVVSSSMNHEINMNHKVVKEILHEKHYARSDFSFEDVYRIAVDRLKNDEHILTAMEFDYLEAYTIVCREDDVTTTEYQREDRVRGYNATYYTSSRSMALILARLRSH